MEAFKYDYYRYRGTTKVKRRKVFKDYRLLYLYAWRKISSGSKMTLFMKLILKRLKHYHIATEGYLLNVIEDDLWREENDLS